MPSALLRCTAAVYLAVDGLAITYQTSFARRWKGTTAGSDGRPRPGMRCASLQTAESSAIPMTGRSRQESLGLFTPALVRHCFLPDKPDRRIDAHGTRSPIARCSAQRCYTSLPRWRREKLPGVAAPLDEPTWRQNMPPARAPRRQRRCSRTADDGLSP